MAFKVQTTDEAEQQIEEAFLWLAERTETHAIPWLLGLREAIASLSSNPNRRKNMADSHVLGNRVQQLLYRDNYRILYEVRGDVVWVLSVRHASRSE